MNITNKRGTYITNNRVELATFSVRYIFFINNNNMKKEEVAMKKETLGLYDAASGVSEGEKRQRAVEAALELIKAESLGGGSSANTLYSNMSELSKFADQIQKALEF